MMTAAALPPVTVIVITCNGRHHLERCLPSLVCTDYPGMQIVIVDNASTDGSAEYVTAHYPEATILRNRENRGFAGGNNGGMTLALSRGARYVVLLNDDTEILDPRWLRAAVELMEQDATIGMAGFRLTNNPAQAAPPALVSWRPVRFIEGCALVIRGALLRSLGLFDEVYFAYAEENDLELRAVRAGYQLIELNIPLFHLGGGTSQKIPAARAYLLMRNEIRCSLKNRSMVRTLLRVLRILDVSCSPFPLLYDPEDATHRRMRNQGDLLRNLALYLRAVSWNVRYLRQTLAIRAAEEQRIRLARRRLGQHAGQPGERHG